MRTATRLQIILSFFLMSYPLYAVSVVLKVNVEVLTPAPCSINGGDPIIIDFDEGESLVTTRINGSRYQRKLKLNLVCEPGSKNALRMRILGRVAQDDNILGTTLPGLGIALRSRGLPMPMNEFIYFNQNDDLDMNVVPVPLNGQSIVSGGFTASAMLQLFYQ